MAKNFVYVLRSLSSPKRRYVGLTSDVRRRIEVHNAGMTPSTTKHRPWALSLAVEFTDERRAERFERYLKSPSGRAFAKRHFQEAVLPVSNGIPRTRACECGSQAEDEFVASSDVAFCTIESRDLRR